MCVPPIVLVLGVVLVLEGLRTARDLEEGDQETAEIKEISGPPALLLEAYRIFPPAALTRTSGCPPDRTDRTGDLAPACSPLYEPGMPGG
jgi:hypothetical protein